MVGIDHIPELVDWSVENLKRDNLAHAVSETKEIEMIAGDGRQGAFYRANQDIAPVLLKIYCHIHIQATQLQVCLWVDCC